VAVATASSKNGKQHVIRVFGILCLVFGETGYKIVSLQNTEYQTHDEFIPVDSMLL
jgi:hypothetical protein